MQYNVYKNLRVSEICFGTWGIGGYVPEIYAYGPKDDAVSRRALEVAYEQGINFFDTACSYGFGRSEKLLGEVFSSVPRTSVVFATKAGFLPYPTPDGNGQCFDPLSITTSVLGSLLRLKTNYVDILQLHSPLWEDWAKNQELLQVLSNIRESGLARLIGFAARTPADAAKALRCKWFKFDVVQCNLNLTDMRAFDDGVFAASEDTQTKVMVRSPLLHGFLTGQLNKDTLYHPNDHRTRFTNETIHNWLAAQERFKEVLNSDGLSPTINALRFCLSFSNILSVVTGMNTALQVCENIQASCVPRMPHAMLEKALEVYRTHYQYQPVKRNDEK